MPTITMQAPTTWPFRSPVVPAAFMPSGNAYHVDSSGQIEAQQADAGALVGYGFIAVNSSLEITALTGDVLASGSGSQAATLASTAVTAGSYINSNITVDAKGRITSAASGNTPTVRTVSGTTDTILAADKGNVVRYTSGSSIGIDVPGGLGAGFSCLLVQIGAGAFTVTGTTGATVANRQSQLASAGANAVCSLFADAADHLLFAGDTA